MIDLNIVIGGMLILLMVVLAMILAYIIRASELRTGVRKALIEKFSSAQDLNDFMGTPAGRRLFGEFTSGGSPLRSIAGSIQKGIMGLVVGVGLMVTGGLVTHDGEQIVVLGAVFALVGLAFLISSAVAYKLSKSWGLIEKKD